MGLQGSAVALACLAAAAPCVGQAMPVPMLPAAAAVSSIEDASQDAAVDLIRFARHIHRRPTAPSPPRPSSPPAGDWEFLSPQDVAVPIHNDRHAETYSKYARDAQGNELPNNEAVLRAIDVVQRSAMDGGGYFANPKARPPESPIGYDLKLFGVSLFPVPANHTRTTSFCTGAAYAALVEALDLLFSNQAPNGFTPERAEAFAIQEPDGSRRADYHKFWGRMNGDFSAFYAMTQYTSMGQVIAPEDARAGDFITIHFKNGHSHSAIFLGWYFSKTDRHLVFWSSQQDTIDASVHRGQEANGLSDDMVSIYHLEGVKVVRLVNPDAITSFDPGAPDIDPEHDASEYPPLDPIDWSDRLARR